MYSTSDIITASLKNNPYSNKSGDVVVLTISFRKLNNLDVIVQELTHRTTDGTSNLTKYIRWKNNNTWYSWNKYSLN